jgi:hypothetical protein
MRQRRPEFADALAESFVVVALSLIVAPICDAYHASNEQLRPTFINIQLMN